MSLTKKIVDITRNLRRHQTPQEKQLWKKLRNRKLNWLKFLRQHPIVYDHRGFTPLFFVADFFCSESKLVIELDGEIHEFQKHYDKNRDCILKELGLTVLRIMNDELNDIDSVLKKILKFSTHPPATSLQSREGVSKRSEDGGELALLILAAGPSSRLGHPKQQLLIHGTPLLLHTVMVASDTHLGNVAVVIGHESETHQKLLERTQARIIFNDHWQKGMGSSLKAGLNALIQHHTNLKAVLVMVCDQPLITASHLKQLVTTFRETHHAIVASYYANTTGVPALFSKSMFSELLNLADEEGAKKIISRFADQVATVPFEDAAIDMDTPEDYQRFIKSEK